MSFVYVVREGYYWFGFRLKGRFHPLYHSARVGQNHRPGYRSDLNA